MVDITAVGEILIDLTQSGVNGQGLPRFDANPGGAPANLAVAASRLGAGTAFIGKVGKDSFGDSLRNCLTENGVDVTGMVVDPVQHTTLAVVSLDPSGERHFSFYRDPSADVNLKAEEISTEQLKNTRFYPGYLEADNGMEEITVFYEDIRQILHSEHLLVLLSVEKVGIMVARDGFVSGDAATVQTLIEEEMGRAQ